MLEWIVPLMPEEILTLEQTMRIKEYATKFFGGGERCYVEVRQVRGKEYALQIKIR